METKTEWRIDRRKKSIKIIDANFNPVASIIEEENADLIVKAVNNFYAMKNYIKEMAKRYENSEWISGEANNILNNINESK